jgi:hypothetical protein
MKKGVYKFHWDYGRMGEVDGVFVASQESIAKAIGKQVYFGEILGKHSEVYGELDDGDYELLTDNPEVVALVLEHKLESGYNPLDYIEEME